MSEQEKKCGTCKWFDRNGLEYFGDSASGDEGWCGAPVPESVCVDYREIMTPSEGAECPCWSAKE